MELIRNILGFFRYMRHLFKEWFLPRDYSMSRTLEQQLDNTDDNAPEQSDKTRELSEEKSPAAASNYECPVPEYPTDRIQNGILEHLAIHNSRRLDQIAKNVQISEHDCREYLQELIQQGFVDPGKNLRFTIAPAHRRQYMEACAPLKTTVDTLVTTGFRSTLYMVLAELLEKFPVTLKPREQAVDMLLLGRRVGRMLLYGNSVTVEVKVKLDDSLEEQLQKMDVINRHQDGATLRFDWHPRIDPDDMSDFLASVMKINLKRHRRKKKPRKRNKQ